MSRRALAPVLLVALAVTSGCMGIFGPAPVDREALAEDANYEWNTSRSAYLEVHQSDYAAVYRVADRTTGNREGNYSIELYTHDALGREEPMELSAVQFRYPNGTVVRYVDEGNAVGRPDVRVVRVYPNGTREPAPGELVVERTRKHAVVYLPANATGRVAFTAPKQGKSVSTPTFVRGSYEMVLPERARVGVPILAQVRPRQDAIVRRGDNVHVVWNDVSAPAVRVRYYLARDLLIFGGIVAALSLVGLVGSAYYLVQIRRTVAKREEVGLDVDVTDDDREGPPPGMR